MTGHSVAPEQPESSDATPIAGTTAPPARSRRWWRLLLPSIAISVGLAIVAPALLAPQPETAAPQAALPVKTIAVAPVRSYNIERTYSGELVARRRSDLGFERAGTITEIQADDGDRVVAGQVLARLDARSLVSQRQELVAQRAQAEAQLQELQAGPRREDIAAARAAVAELQQQLELSELKTERREYLYEAGAIAREDFDIEAYNARALGDRLRQAQSNLNELLAGTRNEQVAAQRARVDQIDASIRRLDVELDKSVLRAPFAGRVSQRAVDEGAVVANGALVLQLLEQDTLEARVGLPSDAAEGLAIGSEQAVQVGDRTYSARTLSLLPALETDSRTVTAVLAMPPAADLRAGQTAQLKFRETQATEGFWLPSAALIPGDRGLWSVYVLGAAGSDPNTYTVARREVEVLHAEDDRLLVRGTLQAGEQAIASGTHRLVAGQTVTLAATDPE